MNQRSLAKVVLVALLSLLAALGHAKTDKPNIMVIWGDDIG